jgi:hypothetical protein
MSNSLPLSDYPYVLSEMLYRPTAGTIVRWAVQPDYLADPRMRPGQVYMADRFGYLPDTNDMDIESRTRSTIEIIGTANTRQIPRSKVPIVLREITGPGGGDPNNPGLPGNFRFSIPDMMYQQRLIWDMGQAEPLVQPQFHASVGATTLLQDFRLTTDRFYLNALDSSTNKYNPNGVADGGTYASGPPKFTVGDLDRILEQLVTNRAPTFPDNMYHAIIHQRMWTHLREDARFRELVTSSAYYSVPMVMAAQEWLYGPGYMPPANLNYMAQPNIGGFLPYYNQNLPGPSQNGLPGGFVFNQFRIWISNNIPLKQVTLNYTTTTDGSATGSQLRTAYPGYFFGAHAVGEIFGGDPADGVPVKVKRNLNDDYGRYLIVIWQAFMGLTKLNDDFIIVGRTYAN